MAESIFRQKVREAGLSQHFVIESAGTGDWHVGQNPDPRTIRVLQENGIEHFSPARQVNTKDFQTFDYVIAMDKANLVDLYRWPGSRSEKVSLMLNWGPTANDDIVPDPYYGEYQNFQEVYQLLDEASEQILTKLLQIHQISRTREL